MELKTEKKTIFRVNSNEFDRFVKEIYRGNFEFVADHEANNDSSYEFSAPNMNMDFNGEYEAKIRNGKFSSVPILFKVVKYYKFLCSIK